MFLRCLSHYINRVEMKKETQMVFQLHFVKLHKSLAIVIVDDNIWVYNILRWKFCEASMLLLSAIEHKKYKKPLLI